MEELVISKQRISDHGEVFTREREVNDMLNLVRQETERIDSRFLEPACGRGNFLGEVLRRKLRVVRSRYRKSQLEYERNLVLAVSSIYGIDIQQDNVAECRERLYQIADEEYSGLFKKRAKDECRRVIRYILERNIIWGDALTLKTPDKKVGPIVFSEWSAPFHNSLLKRRDFTFSDLLSAEVGNQPDLFSTLDLVSDLGEAVFLPRETRSYAPIHFLKIGLEHD